LRRLVREFRPALKNKQTQDVSHNMNKKKLVHHYHVIAQNDGRHTMEDLNFRRYTNFGFFRARSEAILGVKFRNFEHF
jgi:hypothetical protein